jgi:outer membrane protein
MSPAPFLHRLVVCAAAWAGTAAAQPLPELARLALAADPVVVGAEAQARAAEQRLVQARAAFGPTLNLTANQSETDYKDLSTSDSRPFRGKQVVLQLTQPVLRPALFSGLRSAEAQHAQARAQHEQARLASLQRLMEACFDLLKARDTLRFARSQQLSTGEQMAAAQRKYRVGTAPVTDVREAEAKADVVAAQLAAAEHEVQMRQQILAELVGRPVDALLVRSLQDDRLPPLEPAAVARWLDDAQAASPQVAQARLALDAAVAEVERASLGHAPTLDLTASHTRNRDTGSINILAPRRYDATQVGVNFNLPLFASGATQSKVQEAIALRDKAQGELDAARRGVVLGVRQQWSAALSAMAQAQGYATAVRSGELSLQANRRGYEVGVRVAAEVLDAQTKLFESQREMTRSRYDAWLGLVRLKVLAGRLDDTDLAQLDGLLVERPLPAAESGRAREDERQRR